MSTPCSRRPSKSYSAPDQCLQFPAITHGGVLEVLESRKATGNMKRAAWPGHAKNWATGALAATGVLTLAYGLAGGLVVWNHALHSWDESVAAQQARTSNAFWHMVAGTEPFRGVPGRLAHDLRSITTGRSVAQQLDALMSFRALDGQYPGINTSLGAGIISYQPSGGSGSNPYSNPHGAPYPCKGRCSTGGPLSWQGIDETLAALHGDNRFIERVPPVVEPPGILNYTYYGYGFSFFVIPAALEWLAFFSIARIRNRRKARRKALEERQYYASLPTTARNLYALKLSLQKFLEKNRFSSEYSRVSHLLARTERILEEILQERDKTESDAKWGAIEKEIGTNEILGRTYTDTLKRLSE